MGEFMFFKMSPTIVTAYIQDPEWFSKTKIKDKLFDIQGFDCWGYNASGIDRAGNTKSQYEHGPTKMVEGEIYYDLYEETVALFNLTHIIDRDNEPKKQNVSNDANNSGLFVSHYGFLKERNLKKIEEKYNATFVAFLPLKTMSGNWTEDSFAIFYQKTPPQEGYSNYFAIYSKDGTPYITSGQSAIEGIITGAVAKDGEIIYSSCRHDCRVSQDGTVWIDGGRDYTRAGNETFAMYIKDGKFYKV